MHNKRTTILAINPGTRYIGIAVLKGPLLVDWSVKVVPGRLSPDKFDKTSKLICQLIVEHQPDVLVVKRLHSSRSSPYLDRLSQRIGKLALADSIELTRYSIEEMREFYAPEERINKTTLSELVCRKHPVLHHELRREQDSLNTYHARMFEAVALGTMAEAKSKGNSLSSIPTVNTCPDGTHSL